MAEGVSFDALPIAESRTAAYALVRAAGPVTRTAKGGYVLASIECAEYALKHPELFSSARALDAVGSPLPMVPIAFDPPEHVRYRRVLQPFFGPRGAAAWQPRVRALVGELIDGFIGSGECDLVADLAVPLPAEVFLTMFGLPLADRNRLLGWKDVLLSNATFGLENPPDEVVQAGAELFGYLAGAIELRRAEPGSGDLLGQLVSDDSAERLTDTELIGLSFLLVLAGLDTVTSVLSTSFAILAGNEELRRQLARDPTVVPSAVEELLRYDGPTVFLPRVATKDVELGGQLIPADSFVMVAISVANRDPAEHPDPDRIDFSRQERHLAFGGGPHRCLGAHLARMELREVLSEWHKRIPDYLLAPGTVPRVPWPSGLVGLESLPLTFPPGGSLASRGAA
jgi:cytochrome P450